MVKLNMAKVNTLIRKGYLLAGVVMAANMFVVNEVKAMNSQTGAGLSGGQGQETMAQFTQQNDFKVNEFPQRNKTEVQIDNKKQSSLDKLLSCENYINLFGTLALSGFNNYFKWWDYNPGGYLNLRIGCLGWRTKKFFDTVQLDFNLNLGRGAIWLIPHIINLIMIKTKAKKGTKENIEKIDEENGDKSGSNASPWVSFLFKGILQGLISIPLTFHISKFNFSISISLDSILWKFVIDKKFFKNKQVQPEEGQGEEGTKEIDTKA